DCSICRGPVCQTCDFDCVHGTCERETRTCSCARGWSGAACDICRSANCQVKSSVLYILPSTADREDVNVVVNVFGVEFPKTPSQTYTCIFGASYAEGRRISSSVVRCRVPRDLSIGRHLFNLAPEGSISVIPNFDVRPIHFTVFDSCSSALCKGVCIGPLCVCPKGTTGINCEIIEIIPSIDRRFIENQKASVASEGTPYIVVLPTMPGSLQRVNSTIDDLRFDSSRGIIEWKEPVGSNIPYSITVSSSSLSGGSSISWNVTVEPSYTAEVTAVEKLPESSTMRITGRLREVE
ncbi:EGF-like domain protein, partial [Ostertagia ostertagi]